MSPLPIHCHEQRVKKSEASTLGAILVRERAGSTTELGEVLDLSVSVQAAEVKMEVDVVDVVDGGGGCGGLEGEEAREQEEGGWPSVQQLVRCVLLAFGRHTHTKECMLPVYCLSRETHTHTCSLIPFGHRSKSGAPFGYVRSLWVALTSDRAALEKEAIWGIYQELRRLAPQLAAEVRLHACRR